MDEVARVLLIGTLLKTTNHMWNIMFPKNPGENK